MKLEDLREVINVLSSPERRREMTKTNCNIKLLFLQSPVQPAQLHHKRIFQSWLIIFIKRDNNIGNRGALALFMHQQGIYIQFPDLRTICNKI